LFPEQRTIAETRRSFTKRKPLSGWVVVVWVWVVLQKIGTVIEIDHGERRVGFAMPPVLFRRYQDLPRDYVASGI